jgi:single-strand DNA-binding protein
MEEGAMNRVELTGGVVRINLEFLQSGLAMCRFTLGVKDAFYNPELRDNVVRETFVSCVAWGDTAESIGETYGQGDQLYVMGELSQEKVPNPEGKKSDETKTRVLVLFVRGLRKSRASVPEQAPATAGSKPPF